MTSNTIVIVVEILSITNCSQVPKFGDNINMKDIYIYIVNPDIVYYCTMQNL